jgi:hypothetical protein
MLIGGLADRNRPSLFENAVSMSVTNSIGAFLTSIIGVDSQILHHTGVSRRIQLNLRPCVEYMAAEVVVERRWHPRAIIPASTASVFTLSYLGSVSWTEENHSVASIRNARNIFHLKYSEAPPISTRNEALPPRFGSGIGTPVCVVAHLVTQYVWDGQKCRLSFSTPMNQSIQSYIRALMTNITARGSCCLLNIFSFPAKGPVCLNISGFLIFQDV